MRNTYMKLFTFSNKMDFQMYGGKPTYSMFENQKSFVFDPN